MSRKEVGADLEIPIPFQEESSNLQKQKENGDVLILHL